MHPKINEWMLKKKRHSTGQTFNGNDRGRVGIVPSFLFFFLCNIFLAFVPPFPFFFFQLGFLSTTRAQPEQKAPSLIGKYHHVDRITGQVLTCDKCPAGTYVSKHCTNTSLRVCSSCPAGTFTRHENGIEKCHECSQPCPWPMIEKLPCTALTDRECTCPPGMFQSNGTCAPHTVCPMGWGVRKKGTEMEDVRCKQCARGTFSDVPSSVMRCRAYTDCLSQNMVVIKLGTKEADNVCGPLPSSSSTAPPSPGTTSLSRPEHMEPQDVPSSTLIPKGNLTSWIMYVRKAPSPVGQYQERAGSHDAFSILSIPQSPLEDGACLLWLFKV